VVVAAAAAAVVVVVVVAVVYRPYERHRGGRGLRRGLRVRVRRGVLRRLYNRSRDNDIAVRCVWPIITMRTTTAAVHSFPVTCVMLMVLLLPMVLAAAPWAGSCHGRSVAHSGDVHLAHFHSLASVPRSLP
jgi:hypothetical protein